MKSISTAHTDRPDGEHLIHATADVYNPTARYTVAPGAETEVRVPTVKIADS